MSKNFISLDNLKAVELTDRDKLKISAAFQQLYWETGESPSIERVSEFLNWIYPVVEVRNYIESQDFQEKIERLGIKTDAPTKEALSPEQLLIANMELNLYDKRSIRQKLEELKIPTSRYDAWKRDPAYQAYYTKRAEILFKDIESEALKQLAKAVSSGDQRAVQLALEMKNRYSRNVNVNINVEHVLIKVVEIVALHIKDPETLEAIASEIEKLSLAS